MSNVTVSGKSTLYINNKENTVSRGANVVVSDKNNSNAKVVAAKEVPNLKYQISVGASADPSRITEQYLVTSKDSLLNMVNMNTSGSDYSCFHPNSYMTLLSESLLAKGAPIYTEKEYQQLFSKVTENFMKSDDWQARMNALGILQKIMLGDGSEYLQLFIQNLKSIHEQVCSLCFITLK